MTMPSEYEVLMYKVHKVLADPDTRHFEPVLMLRLLVMQDERIRALEDRIPANPT
jgi:hypothetical protein